MYFNRAIECGRVGSEPTIRTSRSGKNFVTLRLGVKRGAKKEFDNFNLSAYGEIGNQLLESAHVGDYICVCGPVSASAFNSADGKAGVNLMMLVTKWEPDPATKFVKEAEKEITEGTAAEEEMDNDEILF